MTQIPEVSTLQAIGEYLSLLQPIVWGLILWGWWSLKKVFVPRKECDSCREDLKKSISEEQKELFDTSVKHLPSTDALQTISLTLARLEAQVSGQAKAMERVERNIDFLTGVHVKP